MHRAALVGLSALALAACSCRPSQPAAPAALTLSLPYHLDSLVPGQRDRLSDFAVLSNVYETLVTTDAQLTVRTALAERWENPDERTWVFHLRPNVLFHDGATLSAQDVVFSYQRLARDPSLEAARHVVSVKEVRALDARSVLLRTRTPLADFLNRVRFIHVVRDGSTDETLGRGANGTGPYRLAVVRGLDTMELERNERYWGPRPGLPRAVLRLGRDAGAALDDVLSGGSGFAQANSLRALQSGESRPDLQVRRGSSIAVKMLLFDVSRERTRHVSGGRNPFRDLRVRQAVQLALDGRRLVEALPVPAFPAPQLVPRFIFGFDPLLSPPASDLVRAKALLAEAGFPDGFRVTLHARSLLGDGAAAVKSLLAEAAIRVDVRALPEKEFFEETHPDSPDFVVGLTRFGCPTGDAANFLDAALHSLGTSGYGRVNAGGYANPEVDRLIEEAGRTLDPSLRLPMLQQVMRIAMRDLPWLPLYLDEDVYLLRSGLRWEPRLDNYVLLSEIGTP